MNKTLHCIASFLLIFSLHEASAIVLDGNIEEPEWQDLISSDQFKTVQPFNLQDPEYQTEVKLRTDETGIYFGVISYQPSGTQISRKVTRDGLMDDIDFIRIDIDFNDSRISAYSFQVSNGGSIRDGSWQNESIFNRDWNGVWSAVTSQHEDKWIAELHIPWDVVPMKKNTGGQRSFGFAVTRGVSYLKKFYSSAPIDETRQKYVSHLESIKIDDYSGSSIQRFVSLTNHQNNVSHENETEVGLDVFWKPSSDKQLSLTLNPDFGHVESDRLVVDFSPTEVFFAENRPFFTENQSLFDLRGPYGLRLIHTRRIGGAPDIGDEKLTDLIGAVKFTQVGSSSQFGLFSAVEDESSEAKGRKYYAGRALKKINNSEISYLATYVNRPDKDRESSIQAIDAKSNIGEGLILKGQFINSHVNLAGETQRSSGSWLGVQYQNDETWEHVAEITHYDNDFDVNDFGFLPRNDLRALFYWLRWKNPNFTEDSIFNERRVNFTTSIRRNASGEKIHDEFSLADRWFLKNTVSYYYRVYYYSSGYDDLITRGNNKLKKKEGIFGQVFYVSDSRKPFRFTTRLDVLDRMIQGRGYRIIFSPSYQFSEEIGISANFNYRKSDDWLIWDTDNIINSYIEERLTSKFDFSASIKDKHELLLRFEWIALNAEGKQEFTVEPDGNLAPTSRSADDFSVSDTAVQIRYKYELGPLSNIFLTYSRGGRSRLDEDLGINDLFTPGWKKRDGDNVFVKFRYQF